MCERTERTDQKKEMVLEVIEAGMYLHLGKSLHDFMQMEV